MGINTEFTKVGYELPVVAKKITPELLCNYSNRYPGVFIRTIHTDKEAAAGWGFKDMVLQGSQTMNFGGEVLFKIYREYWVTGSSLTVKFTKPVLNGETVTTKAKVKERKEENGKILLMLDVWSEDTAGDKVMVGEATIRI